MNLLSQNIKKYFAAISMRGLEQRTKTKSCLTFTQWWLVLPIFVLSSLGSHSARAAGVCIGRDWNAPIEGGVLRIKLDCNTCAQPKGALTFCSYLCCPGAGDGPVTWTIRSAGGTGTLGLKFTPADGGSGCSALAYEPASDIPGTVKPGALIVTAEHGASHCSDSIWFIIEGPNCCAPNSTPVGPFTASRLSPTSYELYYYRTVYESDQATPPYSSPSSSSYGSSSGTCPVPPSPVTKTPSLAKPLLLGTKVAPTPAGNLAAPGSVTGAKAVISLGAGDFGDVAGALTIFEELPSSNLSTPMCLHYGYSNDYNEVIMDSGVIKQVRAPATFVNVTTNNAYKYTVDYYKTNVITGKAGSLYTFSGAPLGTITIENTNTTGSASNTVRITDAFGYVTDYVFSTNGVTNVWEKTSGGGARKELNATSWSGSNVTVRTETWNGAAALEAIRVDTYTNAPFGVRRLQSIEGTGAAVRTNTYTYWSNGPVQLVASSDGGWTYTEYDTNNRPTNVLSSYGMQGPTNIPALCRQVEYSYDQSVVAGSGDTNFVSFMTPRRTIERLLGNEVRRSYSVVLDFEQRDIVCVNPGAAWNDSSNLVTIRKFVSDANMFNGKPKNILRQDGTLTLFDYRTNVASEVVTTYVGQPGDTNNTNVIAGAKAVTVTGNLGQLISETVSDIASNIVLSSMTYTNYDDANRPTKVTLLDGTSIGTDYGCCGALYTTNQDGSVLMHQQDSLGRYTSTTYNGITATNVFDAAGRLLARLKIGTNGGVIAEVTNTYDTVGRLLTSADALGNTTTYSESADGLSHTNTAPDGSTRVDLYLPDGSLWKRLGIAVHPVRFTNGVESLDGQYRLYDQEIKLDSDGNDTSEWTKTYRDFAGRHYKTVYSDGASSQSFYNLKGQLVKTVDPDGVTMLYAYDVLGQQVLNGLDLDRNGVIDTNGTDRITMNLSTAATVNSRDCKISRSYAWVTNNSSVSNLLSETIMTATGDTTWRISYNGTTGLTNRINTVIGANGNNYVTNTAPDGSYTVSHTLNGLLQSVTRKDSGGNQLAATTYTYDAYGREKTMTDARNGTSTNIFDDLDRVVAAFTPPADGTQGSQRTGYSYDELGRVTTITNADDTLSYKEYFASGELKRMYGSRTYPVEYTYDSQGRMKTMKTWQDYAGNSGTATTTWNYDGYRGFLTNKVYADGKGPSYKYTPAGRLYQRIWARGITTSYLTNAAGGVASLSYSDSTPSVSNTYDRLGRRTTIVDGAGTHVLSYELDGRLRSETNTDGVLAGLAVTNRYDSFNRRTALGLSSDESALVTYGYDGASRLNSVTNGVNTATYSYVANSPLISHIDFKNSGTTRMTTTKSYDYLHRLLAVTNLPSADSALAFDYANNSANQRTSITNADGSHWDYTYDSLGQVTSGRKYWSDGTPVLGQQFYYTFDDIGNRNNAVSGGDASGDHKRTQSYSANNLNQYTQRTVPGYLDILGMATNAATVTVNTQPTSRHSDYYRRELTFANSSGAVWRSITNTAVLASGTNDYVTNWIGNLFLPKTPESFGYDADGNETNDGRWSLIWDGENRLVQMTSLSSAPLGSSNRLTFTYDQQGRRIARVTESFEGGAWSITLSNRYIYDDWNLIAELNATNKAVINSFVWGLDLSDSLQGAGGVGGLLFVSATNAGTHLVGFDGNGNVAALVSAPSGTLTANYEYDPFGNVLRATGPLALLNPFRFSTKYTDGESGFNYYGYRYYPAAAGRWLARDPIAERGGVSLYAFVKNNPVNYYDKFGFQCCALMYESPTWNHSAIDCEDGTYVSAFPKDRVLLGESPIEWHNKSEDEKEYGSPKQKVCFDCIDSKNVAQWLANYKASSTPFCGSDNNCSDVARQAILGSLSADQQKKPTCTGCTYGFGFVTQQVLEDILDSSGISSPSSFEKQMSEWKDNGCSRYRCKTLISSPILFH